jgi:hypothetical protein
MGGNADDVPTSACRSRALKAPDRPSMGLREILLHALRWALTQRIGCWRPRSRISQHVTA